VGQVFSVRRGFHPVKGGVFSSSGDLWSSIDGLLVWFRRGKV
jgi:hypothetical protein